ncbi:MAG: 3-hydroxyacyl-CoA dehydrogenase [Parvularculaceae bacterium]
MNIEGRGALVTGGGSGLGAATAQKLAGLGARVALLDMNIDAARALAEEIGGAAFACDVSNTEEVERAVAAAIDALGEVRAAVNCAGIVAAEKVVGRDGPADISRFARVIAVNLTGTFNVMRLAAAHMAALPPLEDQARGVIVNTASVAAFDGQIGQCAYAASKAGVAGMTLPAARDLSRLGIRVMTIAPGIFRTPMMAGLPQEVQDSLGASVPYPSRLGDPSEFAALAAHIIENQMLNGEVIRLDGAIRMPPK